jgi:hypothetical protein
LTVNTAIAYRTGVRSTRLLRFYTNTLTINALIVFPAMDAGARIIDEDTLIV